MSWWYQSRIDGVMREITDDEVFEILREAFSKRGKGKEEKIDRVTWNPGEKAEKEEDN